MIVSENATVCDGYVVAEIYAVIDNINVKTQREVHYGNNEGLVLLSNFIDNNWKPDKAIRLD